MLTPIERPTFIVHLLPEPYCRDPIRALRQILKQALRSFGLRCVTLSEVKPDVSPKMEAHNEQQAQQG